MKLLKRLAQFSVGSIVAMVLSFASYPIITRIISPEEMGKYSLFNTVLSLVMVFIILGLDQAYGRFFYEEIENKAGLFLTCIKLPLIACIVVSTIVVFFYKPITSYLVGEASVVCIIMVVTFLFSNVLYSFELLYVRMGQQAKTYSLYTVLVKVFYLLAVLIGYFFLKNSYLTLVLATILSFICVDIIAFIRDRKFYVSLRHASPSKISVNQILKYSMPLVLSTAISWIFQSADKIMIKAFTSYSEIGIYAGAMTIVNVLNAVQSMFTTFWVPVAFEHYTKDPDDREFYARINEIVAFVMLLGAVALISLKDILSIVLGGEYSESTKVFPFLVFVPIMYTISETIVMGINFKEQTNKHIIISIVSAVANCIGNYLMVPVWGAKGAAISTGLSYVVLFILRTYYSNKYYKVNYKLKKFAVACVFVYSLAIIHSFQLMGHWRYLISVGVFAVVCYIYKNVIQLGLDMIKAQIRNRQ